jgi:exopolyphosphatase/guanosine-5'-triphosphate,3'-diphosphate pyrophosphatase
MQMRLGILDIGSNTVRLLVVSHSQKGLEPVLAEREHLFLGEDIERTGRISPPRMKRAVGCAGAYAALAREAGVADLAVIVTAPGRQSANGDVLIEQLATATGAHVRLLSADEEGQLAFTGALAAAGSLSGSVAVCDIGGGSTEVVVGTVSGGPAWTRSLDLGAVRLTERFLADDPPRRSELAAAEEEAERCLAGFTPPLPGTALAAGGTARALRKLVGRTLGADELGAALVILSKRPSKRIAKTFDIHPRRARTLAAGATLLLVIERRLGVPLVVSRAGLREGAALELLARAEAAAA